MNFDPKKKLLPFIVFFIVANPATFKLVRSVAGSWVSSAEGLPTTAGLLLHALVFVLLTHFLWRAVFGQKSKFSRQHAVEGAEIDEESCE
jgi:hypothetical protein